METNLFVYIISHITITRYKTKTTTALHAFKIHHKLSVVSSLNNACPYPEPALTHLSGYRPPIAVLNGLKGVIFAATTKLNVTTST